MVVDPESKLKRAMPRVLLVVVVMTGVIAGGTSLGLVSGDSAEAGAIDEETRAVMGVFRDPRTTADEMPGNPEATLRSAGDMQAGEDVGLSRRIPYPGGDAFVWPMDGGVCHVSAAGSGCVSTRLIKEDGVALGVQSHLDLKSRTYRDVRVFGLARDGIETVRLTLGGGGEVTALVRQNTFQAVDLADRPATVSWRDAGGAHSVEIPGQSAADLAEEIAGPKP
jgi:hypothetical protein